MEKRKAFTLIELMGVLVIIGLLTVILVPVVNNTIKGNKEELYNKQIELIKLSVKNLASDNQYILPEENNEEIYITLGQLRMMGYAEEIIINPLTKENFSDNLIVAIIKKENDYEYEIILEGKEVITVSGITVGSPSRPYIKKGALSSYIITAKTTKEIEDKTMEYYINIEKNNIVLKGEAKDDSVKYKIDGNNGLYKLSVSGGEKEGYLYFNFNELKSIEGEEVDTTKINEEIDNVGNKKQIIVDNTQLTCDWKENSTWTNSEVNISLSGIKSGINKAPMKGNTITKTYSGSGIEIKTENLTYEIEDEAGNKTICSKNVNVYYDTKQPTVVVSNSSEEEWVNTHINVLLTVNDGGSGISDVGKYAQGNDNPSWNENYNWKENAWTIKDNVISSTYVLEQNTKAYFQVCDNVGNCSEKTSTSIKIDKTGPTCNWKENYYWTNSNVEVGVYGTDGGSGMKSGENSYYKTYSSSGEEIATAPISYTVSDNVGNTTQCSKNVGVYHDTLAPRITCVPSNASATQNGTASTMTASECSAYVTIKKVKGTVTVGSSNIFNVDDIAWTSKDITAKACDDSGYCGNDVSWEMSKGHCVDGYCYQAFSMSATDEAGNTSTKTFTYYAKY